VHVCLGMNRDSGGVFLGLVGDQWCREFSELFVGAKRYS
jgi:hypothetical protein